MACNSLSTWYRKHSANHGCFQTLAFDSPAPCSKSEPSHEESGGPGDVPHPCPPHVPADLLETQWRHRVLGAPPTSLMSPFQAVRHLAGFMFCITCPQGLRWCLVPTRGMATRVDHPVLSSSLVLKTQGPGEENQGAGDGVTGGPGSAQWTCDICVNSTDGGPGCCPRSPPLPTSLSGISRNTASLIHSIHSLRRGLPLWGGGWEAEFFLPP